MAVNVYVGAVNGGYAEVGGNGGRVVAVGRRRLDARDDPVERVGAEGALSFVGLDVEVQDAADGAGEPGSLVALAGAQVFCHGVYLEGGVSEVEAHAGNLRLSGLSR